ncbi:MAG: asparagine synthase (glutamine-hydrolyzing) [Candidatus Paceibacterota bacterium]
MCGINGYIKNTKHDSVALLERMNKRTERRGPDYVGIFENSNVAFGHLLLSIRADASASKQPVEKDGSPWVLLFNGQIYNTQQLKRDLPSEYGTTDLDTAVLYATIEKHGWRFIEKIQGMFAIALYNKNEGVIRLYRDPSGQKLLYYYLKDQNFIFSSEIKGILEDKEVDRTVDEMSVSLSVVLGFIPGTKTLFKHIKKLNASEILTYDLKTNTFERAFYKSMPEPSYYGGSFDDALRLLTQEHMQSKRQVAINLSGGLDSSLLLHEISKLNYPVHSYTTSFEGAPDEFNKDAELAGRLAKEYGVTHNDIFVTKKEYRDNFIESYQEIEEPRHNISLPAYFITAKREGINGDGNRVVISGDGGDELFGGYPHYAKNTQDIALMRKFSPFIFNLVRNIRNKTPNLDFRDPMDRWYFYKYFKYSKEAFLKKPLFDDIPAYLGESSREFIDGYRIKQDPIYETMLAARITWLAGENFIRSDKLYMGQSLEMRSPLSYHPFRLYVDDLLGSSDYINEKSNKLFLRSWMKGKLPDYITKRPEKTGWQAPLFDESWYDKEMKKLYLSIVTEAEQKGSGLVNWKDVRLRIEKTNTWPGRQVHCHVTLATLSAKFRLSL